MKISCGKGLEKIWGLGSYTRGDVEGLGKLRGLEEKQPREYTTSGNVDHPVLTAGGGGAGQGSDSQRRSGGQLTVWGGVGTTSETGQTATVTSETPQQAPQHVIGSSTEALC